MPLDAKTGKARKEFDLGGDAIAQLACNPTKGRLYATTTTRRVFSIDPASGAVARTAAVGDYIAADPAAGDAVYTGIKPGPEEDDTLIIRTDGRGNFRILWDQWGSRGAILKYAVDGQDLKYVADQANAAVNPFSMCLAPDGKRILMTGGGGWRPPPDAGTGGGYFTPAYSTENLKSMVGQAPHASGVALHPVLNLGAANQDGRKIVLFNAKSMVERGAIDVAPGADTRPALLTFGGKGCKVILWNGDNPANPREGLHFISLDLKAEERAELAKVYSELPPAWRKTRPPGRSRPNRTARPCRRRPRPGGSPWRGSTTPRASAATRPPTRRTRWASPTSPAAPASRAGRIPGRFPQRDFSEGRGVRGRRRPPAHGDRELRPPASGAPEGRLPDRAVRPRAAGGRPGRVRHADAPRWGPPARCGASGTGSFAS